VLSNEPAAAKPAALRALREIGETILC